MNFVKRHDIRRTYSYWCELDEYRGAGGEQFLLAHISVVRWTPGVARQLIREFNAFRKVCPAPLFACPKDADEKWHKFVKLLGFRFLQDIVCENGEPRPLYIHTI